MKLLPVILATLALAAPVPDVAERTDQLDERAPRTRCYRNVPLHTVKGCHRYCQQRGWDACYRVHVSYVCCQDLLEAKRGVEG
jgi:hypothetical protein